MFTQRELNVLQHALRAWPGLWKDKARLTEGEKKVNREMLEVAASLADRVEEKLLDWHILEQATKR